MKKATSHLPTLLLLIKDMFLQYRYDSRFDNTSKCQAEDKSILNEPTYIYIYIAKYSVQNLIMQFDYTMKLLYAKRFILLERPMLSVSQVG
jgi:hypothetical protein